MDIEINTDFKKALNLLEGEKNLFITGRAGTGKSTFLKYFCENTKKQFVLLAPTGVAAVNIGGQTIHSFFRFKPGVTLDEAEKIGKRNQKNKLYQKLELLIIDEISMVRADLFDCVDIFLKKARKNNLPFGGVQLLFIGDLYQLPPVERAEEKESFKRVYESPYFFSGRAMKELTLEIIEFEKIYRQKDSRFINLLNKVRNKSIEEEDIHKLNERYIKDFDEKEYQDHIYLTTRNLQADEVNGRNLDRLKEKKFIFTAESDGEFERNLHPAEEILILKKGARVMFLNNDKFNRWINGSLGWVKKINKEKIIVAVDGGGEEEVEQYTWEINENYFDQEIKIIKRRTIGSFTQVPLKLSWAITIHKSQGKTFDKVVIDIGRGTFTSGQAYVALSRCRSFEGIVLKAPLKKNHIWLDWRVMQFLTNFQYKLAKKELSDEKKELLIRQAIEKKQKIEIIYLKAKDEKSKRIILPKKLQMEEYNGHDYLALTAYCFLRTGERIFNVKRIIQIKQIVL